MRYRAGLETRRRILDATRSSLAERGLDGTTIKEICDRADVRAGSFYNLFGSKEEAILAVLREAIAAVDPRSDDQRADTEDAPTEPDTIDELIEAYIRFVTGEPDLARVYVSVAIGGALTDDEMRLRVLRHHERRVGRFSEAIAAESAELTAEEADHRAEGIVAALNGYAIHAGLDPSFDFAVHARRLRTGAHT